MSVPLKRIAVERQHFISRTDVIQFRNQFELAMSLQSRRILCDTKLVRRSWIDSVKEGHMDRLSDTVDLCSGQHVVWPDHGDAVERQ
jgi:hypothetical protein